MIKQLFDSKNFRTFISALTFFAVFISSQTLTAATTTTNVHTLVKLNPPYTQVSPLSITVQAAIQNVLDQVGIKFNSAQSITNVGADLQNLITPDFTDITWSEAMEIILATQDTETPLTYRIVGSQVVIYKQSTYPTKATLVMNYFAENQGSTIPASSAFTTLVTRGNQYPITATPKAGFHFVSWTCSANATIVDKLLSSTSVSIPDKAKVNGNVVNADATVIANFEMDDINGGLVAYYPFNGDTSDASGNTNNGTVTGAILVPDRFGIPDRAYYFNGSSYIDCGNDISLDLSTFSVSYWIKPDHAPYSGNVSNIGLFYGL